MKKPKDSDRIIERIDSELLKLSYASKIKTPYEFFDFYSALQTFIESALKEGNRKEYFKLKKDRYNIVFRKLMNGVYKTVYTKTLSYNGDSRVQKIRFRYKTLYNPRFIKYYKTIIIEDESKHHSLQYTINELKQSDTRKWELTLYQFLLEDCRIILPPNNKGPYVPTALDAMLFYFHNYFLTETPQDDDDDFLSFESYIRDLEFQRDLIPEDQVLLTPSQYPLQAIPEKLRETETVEDTIQEITAQVHDNSLTLELVFADNDNYHNIMQMLVERGYCQPGTYIWINLKKGYKNLIVSILKYLYFQNYYKSKAGITNEQIKEIAFNTFGVTIARDTIKHADLNRSNLYFIPDAKSISDT